MNEPSERASLQQERERHNATVKEARIKWEECEWVLNTQHAEDGNGGAFITAKE